jgi:hypothetical protein
MRAGKTFMLWWGGKNVILYWQSFVFGCNAILKGSLDGLATAPQVRMDQITDVPI